MITVTKLKNLLQQMAHHLISILGYEGLLGPGQAVVQVQFSLVGVGWRGPFGLGALS